ncbi:HD domain-containing protein [Pelagibius marinus]|uniref:HD domain-containing protein n=1 Tax=Pelagibius marinus TaxID=2762760 RepID=UPI001D0509F6|nr:hypothetical protein [Pelagibius marinus]
MSDFLPLRLMGDLRRRYAEPQRHYHTWVHIEALLGLFHETRGRLHDPAAVEAAIYYRDAVYDPRQDDNEVRSAALLMREGAEALPPDSLDFARRLIEATAGHRLPPDLSETQRADAALFLDMDLSILAAPGPIFAAYEAAIRREYAFVEEKAYRAGRRKVLEGFLRRDRLYFSEHFAARFERPARDNLVCSLELLT